MGAARERLRCLRMTTLMGSDRGADRNDSGPHSSPSGLPLRVPKQLRYFPAQHAGRFCKKAEMPSWASAASEFMVMISFAYA